MPFPCCKKEPLNTWRGLKIKGTFQNCTRNGDDFIETNGFYSSTTTMFQEVRKPSVSGWTNPLVTWLTQLQKMFQTVQQKQVKMALSVPTDRQDRFPCTAAFDHCTLCIVRPWKLRGKFLTNPCRWLGLRSQKTRTSISFFHALLKSLIMPVFYSKLCYIRFRNNNAICLCTLKSHFSQLQD